MTRENGTAEPELPGPIEALIEAALDGAAALDAEGCPIRANARLLAILEVPGLSEIVGRPLWETMHPLDDEMGGRIRSQWRSVCEGSARFLRGEISIQPRRTREAEHAIAYTIVDVGLGEGRTLLMMQDVTRQRKLDPGLAQSQRIDALALMAGGIAHDFNNILTSILGNLSLARDCIVPQSNERILPILRAAEKAASRARDLTRQLMSVARGGEEVRAPADVEDLVREATVLALSGSRHQCQVHVRETPWPCEVDAGQVSQVLHNLLINADQAMPHAGMIEVEVANIELGEESGLPLEPGLFVRIRVMDTGVGISPEDLPHIFEPYFTTKKQGNGLGLAASLMIARQHGGHLRAESSPGEGSIFELYLRANPQASIEDRPLEGKIIHGNGRIMVMDDEPMIQQISGDMLRHLGYEVVTARNGSEAVDRYAAAMEAGSPFRGVILDLTVPGGVGGLEAMQQLREIDPSIKAIVSSGYAADPIMRDPQAYGFTGAVAKPYNIQQISVLLHDILG